MLWWTLRKLNSKFGYTRERAVRRLVNSKNYRAVQALAIALKDNEWSVRCAAADALLGSKAWKSRGRVAKKLVDSKDSRAFEALIAVLKEKESKTPGIARKAAVVSLGMIGDARVVGPLVAALGDRDRVINRAAKEALDKIDPGWAATKAAQNAIPALTNAIKEENFSHHHSGYAEAAETLYRIDQEWGKSAAAAAIVPNLLRLLTDATNVFHNATERDEAAKALDLIDPNWTKSEIAKRAVPELVSSLRAGKEDVRMYWAKKLGEIGDIRAVEPLVTALGDESISVRTTAAEALDRIDPNRRESKTGKRPPDDLGAMLAALISVDSVARTEAESELERIEPEWRESEPVKRIVPRFVAALEDLDLRVRTAAVSALKTIRWEPRDPRERDLFARASEIESFMATRGLINNGEEKAGASSKRERSSGELKTGPAAAVFFDRSHPYGDESRVVDNLLREMGLTVNRGRIYTAVKFGILSIYRDSLPQKCRDALVPILGEGYDESSLQVTPFEMQDGTGGFVVFHP